MGCTFRKEACFEAIPDNYNSVGTLTESNLFNSMSKKGVYVTLMTQWKGKETFEGRSLQYIDPTGRVPIRESSRPSRACLNYLTTITDSSVWLRWPSRSTRRRSLLFFVPGGRECDLDEILQQYFALASSVDLTAPASFVPVIYEAIQRVQVQSRYHILVLVTNGHVEEPAVARQAIVKASAYPFCTGSIQCAVRSTEKSGRQTRRLVLVLVLLVAIIMIGVGDGPWTLMQEFDNKVPERLFDYF
ncbi:hypothetical protein PsorP6_006532 [Peronosclerospora sorghi]|uniref:Uncharacterized protein n=1 Tax=Peronosclerospora sorghi TaxID=230839 RepID=A0ACC0W135_9STRA|nr:hypothetical protein PsorP6_006532 [Peronosclerospora sorghi]